MKFPEQFRLQNSPRLPTQYKTQAGDPFGAFEIPGREACGRVLFCIVADGAETGWDHVSVSIPDRRTKCPSWEEMCIIKALFWEPSECVVQFHPPESDYVNMHGGCLHLWKQVSAEFPQPPKICV